MTAIKKQVFNQIMQLITENDYDAWDILPPPNTPYPFVVVSGIERRNSFTKTDITPRFIVDLDVWGKSQTEVELMVETLYHILNNVQTENAVYTIDLNNTHDWTRPWEEENNETLWRGHLDIELIYKKGLI